MAVRKSKGGKEVGVGYLRIIARLEDNVKAHLQKELDASSIGRKSGEEFTKAMSDSIGRNGRGIADKALGAAAKSADNEGKSAGRNFLEGLKSGMKQGWDERALFRRGKGEAERAGKEAGQAYGGGIEKAMGVAKKAIGIFAVAEVGSQIGSLIADARESAIVGRQTEAVLTAQGKAAKITADQVGDLATKWSNLTGVDDEAIQSAQNLVVATGNVSTETLDKATSAMLNISKARGMSMESVSRLMSRAMADPERGMTALAKAGVVFTDSEKKRIKALKDSGKEQEAQSVILDKVNRQFKDVAKNSADPAERAATMWGNFREELGGKLLPIADKVLNWAGVQLPKAMKAAENGWKAVSPYVTRLGTVIKDFWDKYAKPALNATAGFIRDRLVPGFRSVWAAAQPVFRNVGSIIKTTWEKIVQPALRAMWAVLNNVLIPLFRNVVAPTVMWLWKSIIGPAFTKISEIVKWAIEKVIAPVLGVLFDKITWVAEHIGGFKDGVIRAWEAVSSNTTRIWNGITNFFGGLKATMEEKISAIVGGISAIWTGIQKAFETPVNWVISNVLNKLIEGWNAVIKHIDKNKIIPTINAIGGKAFTTAPGRSSGQQRFASGGQIPGAPAFGYDDRMGLIDGREPIHVGSGEYIVNARATQAFKPLLDKINFGLVPAFASGGQVVSKLVKAFAAGGPVWPTTSQRLSNSYSGHSGIDIPVPIGTPVFAAGPGTVDYVGSGRGYGNAIFQSLPNGLRAVYGHLSQPLVSVGQAITAGMTIGRSGNTGRSTGPHLHFEVAPGGFAQASNRAATQQWLGGAALQGGGGGFSLNPLDWMKSLGGKAAEWMLDKASGAIDGIKGRFGDTGLVNMMTGLTRNLLESVKTWLSAKAPSDSGAVSDFSAATGDQLGNARIIADIGKKMGFSRQGIKVALMTALQESGLRNINYGDRDSVGLFQQRTSQGWGTIAQIMNPSYAASKFFSTLRGVRGWEGMRETVAAQRVQRSGFPEAYQKHAGKADNLLRELGYAKGGLVKPTLYDTGGVLNPGINVVNNQTGGPEYVLPRHVTEGLISGKGKGGAPLVQFRDIVTNDSTEVVEELSFHLNHAQYSRSARYATAPA